MEFDAVVVTDEVVGVLENDLRADSKHGTYFIETIFADCSTNFDAISEILVV